MASAFISRFGDFMYLLFTPAAIAFGVIGYITLRDQFNFSIKR